MEIINVMLQSHQTHSAAYIRAWPTHYVQSRIKKTFKLSTIFNDSYFCRPHTLETKTPIREQRWWSKIDGWWMALANCAIWSLCHDGSSHRGWFWSVPIQIVTNLIIGVVIEFFVQHRWLISRTYSSVVFTRIMMLWQELSWEMIVCQKLCCVTIFTSHHDVCCLVALFCFLNESCCSWNGLESKFRPILSVHSQSCQDTKCKLNLFN